MSGPLYCRFAIIKWLLLTGNRVVRMCVRCVAAQGRTAQGSRLRTVCSAKELSVKEHKNYR